MEITKTYANVRFEFEAIHYNGNAVPGEWYEREAHRHIFIVEARKDCGGLHGVVSAHLLRREMLKWVVEEHFTDEPQGSGALDIERWKCEGLAYLFCNHFGLDWCKVMDSVGTGAEVHCSHDD